MKRKPNVPDNQIAFPIDSQGMITFDDKGNVSIIVVKNQFDPAKDRAILEQKTVVS